MGPLGLEADEAGFNINLPTMDDRSSCLGTIRSSADPYVARHVNSRLLGCRTSVGRHPSHISRPITRLHTAAHGAAAHGAAAHGCLACEVR